MIGTELHLAAVSARGLALVAAAIATVAAVVLTLLARRDTRRRAAAGELLERRLDLAVEAGGMTTWLWDAEDDRLTWDPRAAALYGSEPPRSTAVWVETVHPDDRATVEDAIRAGVTGRSRFLAVHRQQVTDGETRWLELRGEPVLDEDGHLLGTAGVVVDVTDERQAALELAESREALEQILDIAPAFSSDERPEDVTARICDAGLAVFTADACGIWSVEGDDVRPVCFRPPEMGELLGQKLGVDELPHLQEQLTKRSPARVVAGEGDARVDALLAVAGMDSVVIAPLAEQGGVPLYVTLWWEREHRGGIGQLAAVRRFADQGAVALAQARARAARDEIDVLNQTLQAGLLPAPLVLDPGVRVTGRYRPGERRILLGGDFYDVVERPDGEIAFVVGDVTGHGPRPAAIGAALRSAWRALVLTEPDPGRWLVGLGTSLASYQVGPELLVTACTGSIRPDRTSMVVANAGHPAPILLTEGAARLVDVPYGIALGLAEPGAGVETTELPLATGWRLLLYTDGVIEIRTGRRATDRLGQEGLVDWLRHEAPGVDDDALLDALVGHLEGVNVDPEADDIAIVLLGRR